MGRIAILGAGLTGLSAAYHLREGYDIFEQEAEVGGLCRTMKCHDFLFDYTGHLLHLRQKYTKELLDTFLPNIYHQHARKASIYSQGKYVNYPFQANIHALPVDVIKECIIGFVETLQQGSLRHHAESVSFKEWALHTFGTGIVKYFMFPYNQKLWKIPLEELAADWVSWSIPKPSLDEFLKGALGIENREFGYNPIFLYPKTGGVEQLPHAFLPFLKTENLHLEKTAVEVDAEQRIIYFDDNSSYHYDSLISTLPLKQFISLFRNTPKVVFRAGEQLRYISVYDLNIGVNRPNISDKHWIYFPEPEYIFYRVGFPTNFSNDVAPAGCSSMYVEVSALPNESLPKQLLVDRVYEGLQRCGLLRDIEEILVCDIVRIDCAYVIHDLNRPQALKTIFPYLKQHNISSVGRYGAWEYNSMEGAILAGKQAAECVRTSK